MAEEHEISPETAKEIKDAVRAARRAASLAAAEVLGDVEGHSFDEDDILERHAIKNLICCSV